MNFIDKNPFCFGANRQSHLIVVILVGILAIAGCDLKIKQKPSPLLIRLLRGSTTETLTTGTGTATTGTETTTTETIVATPTFSPTAGQYATAQNIAISTTTSGSTLYYTTDGTAPTTSSTVYSSSLGNIWFLVGKTIKAFGTKSGLTDSSVLSGIFSYLPLKTGQTICYDPSGTTGNVSVCSTTTQDGESQTGVARGYTGPTAHAFYTSDYTTTDTATGLVWKSCSQGLSGANCTTGSGATLTWANASADCSRLTIASRTWRLPNFNELKTIVDTTKTTSPTTNTNYVRCVSGP